MQKKILISLLCLTGSAALHAAGAVQPNIVVFLVDDMGWQDTSVPFWTQATEANAKFHTPNMERLAADGMKFTQAYAFPVCTPSRISLMTGLNAARHRVTDWTKSKVEPGKREQRGRLMFDPIWNANGVDPTFETPRALHAKCLPAYLKEAGYRTIHVGKAHFGALGTPAENPKIMGFDVNIAGHSGGTPGSYLGLENFAGNPQNPGSTYCDVPGLEAYHGKDIFLTEALTLEANKAVDQAVADEQPFFLYLAHYAIHTPITEDKRFSGRYKAMGLHRTEVNYASLIEGMDKSLGDIMDNIARHSQEANTIILLMSDNGGMSAIARAGMCHTHNAPLSSGKGSVREGGVRVPMIVKWPGTTAPASTNDAQVIIEDFFPTILALAGIQNWQDTSGSIDGQSFVPLLEGQEPLQSPRKLIWHYPHNWGPTGPGISYASAMRVGNWKLIQYYDPAKEQNLELFNLSEDIGEKNNLVATQPERAEAMKELLTESLRDMDAQLPLPRTTHK